MPSAWGRTRGFISLGILLLANSGFADPPRRTQSRLSDLEERVDQLVQMNLELVAALEERDLELTRLRQTDDQRISALRDDLESLRTRELSPVQAGPRGRDRQLATLRKKVTTLEHELALLKPAQPNSPRFATASPPNDFAATSQKPAGTQKPKPALNHRQRRKPTQAIEPAAASPQSNLAGATSQYPKVYRPSRNTAHVYHTAYGSGIVIR